MIDRHQLQCQIHPDLCCEMPGQHDQGTGQVDDEVLSRRLTVTTSNYTKNSYGICQGVAAPRRVPANVNAKGCWLGVHSIV